MTRLIPMIVLTLALTACDGGGDGSGSGEQAADAGLNQQQQTELKEAYQAAAAEEITADNAEAAAAELEQAIESEP